MVSVAWEKVLFRSWLMNLLYCLLWISDWSQIYPNFFPQSVIKPEMKIKLRMEGAVNGHKFVITGEGRGQPFEWVKV